jgi:ceramide glucosyltransferase
MTAMVASLVLGCLALVGTVLTTVQTLLARRFRRNARPFDPGLPSRQAGFISILKPVCGLDDELEENLRSFVRLDGVDHEVIVSAETADDPALAIVERVIRKHPDAPFRVIVDGGTRGAVVNRKVERLIAAARIARGDVLLISDSNVRVSPADVAQTLDVLRDPAVGCVSNLFVGSGARTLGATLESLHLLSFVVPGSVLAAAVRKPCVVGKSMALTRRALQAIGGFEAFRSVLAEDQAIGLAVEEAGLEVRLSPVVVRNVIVARSVRRALDRQIRWNKIRYAFSRPLYSAEVLLNPLPFAIAAAALDMGTMLLVPAAVAAARVLQLALVNRATGAEMTRVQLAWAPLLDMLMLYAWVIPFLSNQVDWRGYRARIGRHTEMVPM